MQLELGTINSMINKVIENENIVMFPPLVAVSDNTTIWMKYNPRSNIIPISTDMIYAQIPYLMFPYKNRSLKRIIYFHYWAYDNIKNFRLCTSAKCILKLNKLIISNQRSLYKSANKLYLNDIITFYLFHECSHACFNNSKVYAAKEIAKVKSQFDELQEAFHNDSTRLLPTYVKKIYTAFCEEINGEYDIFYEELCCDMFAIHNIFGNKSFFNADVKEIEKIECAKQILNAIVMQEYTACMRSLQNFTFSKQSLKQHNISHIRAILRVSMAVYSLSDLLDNPAKDFRESVSLSHKLLKGFNLFNIFDSAFATEIIEDSDIDFEKQEELLNLFLDINKQLGQLMLGIIDNE